MPNLLRPAALAALTLLSACAGRQAPAPTPSAPEPTPVATAPAQPAPTPPTLRLPDGVRPTHYAVDLTIDPKVATFQGTVDIDLTVSEPTSVVWLNGKDLTVKEATLVQGGGSVAVKPVGGGEDFLGFVLEKPLAPGAAKLRVVYEGTASDRQVNGAFRVNEDGDWYVYTQFEPLGARRVFPSFDEPAYKVPWQLTFHVPEGNVAVTNTPQVASETGPGNSRTFRFAPSQPLPSYLIAFGVGPLDFLDAADSGQKKVKTRIVTPRGRAAEGAWAAKMTPEIIHWLEEYFGIPYAYEKLDIMAVPLMGGAMENPGLVTYNASLLLKKPAEDTVRRQRIFVQVQVHELAHQWFGDLVTMAWWDDLWLNESFASWMEGRILEARQPTWDAQVERVQGRNEALNSDSLLSARRVHQPIEGNDDILNAFDGITYGKGSAVLSMTEAWLGQDVFRRGIQRYLRAHSHRNATAKDFLDALSAESGKDVGAMMTTFLDQSGAPLVTVSLECGAGQPKVVLSQKRYLKLGSKAPAPQSWKVPVCVKYPAGGKDAVTCTLLEQERTELPLALAKACPAWVFPNADGAGFYRLQLTGDAHAKLMKTGLAKLSRTERVALLGDTLALAQAGAVPAAEALPLLARSAEDPDRQVVEAGMELLALVSPKLLPAEQREAQERFVRDTFGPRARKLGFTPRAGESEDTRLLRPGLLELAASQGGDPKLVAEARVLADRWLKDRSGVAPELVDTVLDIAATHGDAAFQARLKEALRTAKDREDRQRIISALGDFADPKLLADNLTLIVDPSQDPRETLWMLFKAAQDARTRDTAFDFLKKNYDTLAGKDGKPGLVAEDFLGRLSWIGRGFCDAGKRQELAAFFAERSARAPGGPRAMAQMLEAVDQCVALKEAQGASIESFLSGRAGQPKPPQAPAAR